MGSPHWQLEVLFTGESPHWTPVVREHSSALLGMLHGDVPMGRVAGKCYTHVLVRGHVLWGEAVVHVKEARRQFLRLCSSR